MTQPLDNFYEHEFDDYIREFCRVTNTETTISALVPIMHILQGSEMLSLLMKDPQHKQAQQCLRLALQKRPHLPHEFLPKFMAIVNLKVNLTPNSLGFVNQSYNAKVIASNIPPPRKITKYTLKNKQMSLIRDAQSSNAIIAPRLEIPPQALKLNFSDSLLEKCVNSIADLSAVIAEGHAANLLQSDEYIRTKMLKP